MTDPIRTPAGNVRMISLPQIHDPRGDLTFVEGGHHIPFDIDCIPRNTDDALDKEL